MLQFWFPKLEFFKFLQPMMGYSEFCRKWILKGIQEEFSEQYWDQQEKTFLEEAKKCRERKKASREDTEEVKKILQIGLIQYNVQMERPMPDIHSFKLYLRSNILPKLTKARCTRFDENSLLEMYQKGEINV